MIKYNTQKLSDSLVEHRVSGTNWIIEEWEDETFTVYNGFTDIYDLFNCTMLNEYKTRELASAAIKEFLENEGFFEMEIKRARELIYDYQQANLAYT